MDELSKFAPLLMSLLFSAIKRHKAPHTDTDCAIVGLCASILINLQNQKMNLVQKINSLILYAGHTSKEVN